MTDAPSERGIPGAVAASRWQWLAVVAIALAATLPFLDKAFHIDDILYLQGADRILHGEAPYDGIVLWDAEDGQPASLFLTDFNPPLWKYFLAAVIGLFGREEWKLHLLESVFVWLAGFGIFALARRFTVYPVWVTAMVLLGPFFLPGQNIMLEGPVLALASWSLEFQFRSWQRDRIVWSWLAGLLLAMAIFTKYTAGVLMPLVLLGCLWARRPASLVALVIPIVSLAAWVGYTVWAYGQSHLGAHGFTLGIDEIPARTLTVLRTIGAVTVFGPVMAALLWRGGRAGRVGLFVTLAGAALLAAIDRQQALDKMILVGWTPRAFQQGHYVVFTAHGAFCCLAMAWLTIAAILRGERTGRTFDWRGFLEVWLAGLFVFNVLCVPFNAVRHLLFFFVPMTLLIADMMASQMLAARWRKGLLICSTLLGVALAAADYEFAGTYRHIAETSVRDRVLSGRSVWYTGNWGFVYYALHNGANPLLKDPPAYGLPPIQAGDYLFNPKVLTWEPFSLPPGIRERAIEHLQPPARIPLRTVAPGVHYYAVDTHALPWRILIDPADPDVPGAWFQLPPIDDILVFELFQPASRPEK